MQSPFLGLENYCNKVHLQCEQMMLYTASAFGVLPHRVTHGRKWHGHTAASLKTVSIPAQSSGAFMHTPGSLPTCNLVKGAL